MFRQEDDPYYRVLANYERLDLLEKVLEDFLPILEEEYNKIKAKYDQMKLENPGFDNFYNEQCNKFKSVLDCAKASRSNWNYVSNLNEAIEEVEKTDLAKKTRYKVATYIAIAIGIVTAIIGIGLIIIHAAREKQKQPLVSCAQSFYKKAKAVKEGKNPYSLSYKLNPFS